MILAGLGGTKSAPVCARMPGVAILVIWRGVCPVLLLGPGPDHDASLRRPAILFRFFAQPHVLGAVSSAVS